MKLFFSQFFKLIFWARYSAKFWLAIAVIFFGLWAFGEEYFNREKTDSHSLDEIAYKTVQLFILQTGIEPAFNTWPLRLARAFAVLWFVSTGFSVFTRVFHESFDSFRLKFMRGHTVVCGLGVMGLQIVEDFLDEQQKSRKWYHLSEWTWPRVVVIESDSSKAAIGQVERRGAVVVIGDATDEALLESVGALKAKRMVVVTGCDEANAEIIFDCVNLLRSKRPSRKSVSKLECFAKITDPTVFHIFSTRVSQYIPKLPIELRVFNPTAICTRRLLEKEAVNWRPVSNEETGLFVLIGFEKAGQTIALQIAELAHFENRKRQRLLVVENNIGDIASRFTAQFGTFTHDGEACAPGKEVKFMEEADDWRSRSLRPIKDEQTVEPGVEYVCNTKFVEAPRHYSERCFIDMLHRLLAEENVKPTIVVCRDQDRENFDIAGIIADSMTHQLRKAFPIYVWLPRQKALSAVLQSELEQSGELSASSCFVRPFGDCKEVTLETLLDSDVERNARRLHENYQQEQCDGKRSGVCANWEDLSETFRQSNRSAAIHASIKQEVLKSKGIDPSTEGVSDSDADLLSEIEHNRWVAERLLAGWRYGPVRDNQRRLRPSVQPWESLPDKEVDKDRSQIREIFKIVRGKTKQAQKKGSAMRKKKIAVAMVRDDDGKFLLVHNENWGGFNFPMTELDENRPPLGSKAISALESEIGSRLQKAVARELEYLGQYGISDRTGEGAVYEYWLYEVDPGEPLEIDDAITTKYLTLDEIVDLTDGTWSAKAIANELLNNREVAVAVVSRLGKEETEYLVIKNDNYGGYFFPSMRRKTETAPETVAEKLFRDDFGYTGQIGSVWKAEVEDVHFSNRFQTDTQFRFHICDVKFPELDIHMPFNSLERKLHERGFEFNWVTADELEATDEYSETIRALKNQLLASIPPETRSEPLPISEGGIALITREVNGETQYLAQWNDKWKAFSFVGGHREEGETFRECVVRETCEELGLRQQDFTVSQEPVRELEYLAISNRTHSLTQYKHSVFDVNTASTTVESRQNIWLSKSEIVDGETNDGRKVSQTFRTTTGDTH